jgi:hypothetical protein
MIASKRTFFASIFFLSAFVLAAVVYMFGSSHQKSSLVTKDDKALRLFLPTDNGFRKYSTQALLEEIKHKKIIRVELTGVAEEDEKRFQFIRQEARRLQYTYDTTSVLHVHFRKESTYGQFVYLTDMMTEDHHKRFGITNDDFYIFGEDPSTK